MCINSDITSVHVHQDFYNKIFNWPTTSYSNLDDKYIFSDNLFVVLDFYGYFNSRKIITIRKCII